MGIRFWLAALAALAPGASPAVADVWDVQFINDNLATTTRNELVHGTEQIHDLAGTADNDYYLIGQKPFSSYEIVVDSVSGDFGTSGPLLIRGTSGGTSLQFGQSVTPILNSAFSLRWANTTSVAQIQEVARVFSANCSLCDSTDQYHIRFYETTTSIARFNNSGSQTTILLLQNPTDYAITGVVYYWNAAGALITSVPMALGPKRVAVTTTSGPAPGVSGSITIAHDARYGDLKGKTVALEPSTGFSFDTPMEHRPR